MQKMPVQGMLGGCTHREVGYLVVAFLLPHDREEQVTIVSERRDPKHSTHIIRQVVGKQLHSNTAMISMDVMPLDNDILIISKN